MTLPSVRSGLPRAAASAAFFTSLAGFFAVAGGLLIQLFADDPFIARVELRAALTAAFAVSAAATGTLLYRALGRRFVFQTFLFFLLSAATLQASNFAVYLVTPRWPLIGLHGVQPRDYWREAGGAIGFNAWGQRDRERTRRPARGVKRIAFVGDSFVEESTVPVSVRVEQKVLLSNVEIINLGVSASAPDEYFYRIKNIAIPLGVSHCFLFFYTGNDMAAGSTLRSFWGLAAAYPRDSLLSSLGLLYLNHLLTNRYRPFLAAWGEAGLYHQLESARWSKILAADDERMRQFALTLVDEPFRSALNTRLSLKGAPLFFEALRRPDENLFRSYYVEAALRYAAGQIKKYERISEEPAYRWIRRAADLCRRQGIGFTLVVVPDAFEVDSRMRKQYGEIADMNGLFRTKYEAAQRLMSRARADGLACLDLGPALKNQPGAYLNLDGHWSELGLELVSDVLARAVRERP